MSGTKLDHVQQLEAILLDYVERYGLTSKARDYYAQTLARAEPSASHSTSDKKTDAAAA